MNPESLKKLRDIRKLIDDLIAIEMAPEGDSLLSREEVNLLKSGRTIDAIKAVRIRCGIGLKEAKDLVEQEATKLGLRVPDPTCMSGYRWVTP